MCTSYSATSIKVTKDSNSNFIFLVWTEKELKQSKNQITRNLINLRKFVFKRYYDDLLTFGEGIFAPDYPIIPANPVCHKPIYSVEQKEKRLMCLRCSYRYRYSLCWQSMGSKDRENIKELKFVGFKYIIL